jgi:hypothetical protein
MLVAALTILAISAVLYLVIGWVMRAIIFCGFWALAYWYLFANVEWCRHVAITFGNSFTISWAAVVPGIVCLLCLMLDRE